MIMYEKIQIFEPRFNDDELETEFNNFFHKYNLTALFTNEHRAGSISVSYVDARSVIASSGHFSNVDGERAEHGGSYHETLKEFADLLTIGNDNKSYEEALFKIIYESRSFQSFMKKIKDLLEYAKSIDTENLNNLWNIVFYNKDVY